LFAEAILSSALRKAKRDLAHKQEEKRRKLRLFCLSRKSNSHSESSELEEAFELIKPPNQLRQTLIARGRSCDKNGENLTENSYQVSYVLQDLKAESNINSTSFEMTDADTEVKSCLASLESFFKELKSVRVKT